MTKRKTPPKPQKPRKSPKKAVSLATSMDDLAADLLRLAKNGTVTNEDDEEEDMQIPLRLDIFDKVAKWIAVRQRVEGGGNNEGSELNAFRDRLKSKVSARESRRAPANTPDTGKIDRAPYSGHAANLAADGNGGPTLEALRSRISAPDGRGPRGASEGSISEASSRSVGYRSLRSGASVDGGPVMAEDTDDDDL